MGVTFGAAAGGAVLVIIAIAIYRAFYSRKHVSVPKPNLRPVPVDSIVPNPTYDETDLDEEQTNRSRTRPFASNADAMITLPTPRRDDPSSDTPKPHVPSPYKSYRPFAANAAAMITLPAPRHNDPSSGTPEPHVPSPYYSLLRHGDGSAYETITDSHTMPHSGGQNTFYGIAQRLDSSGTPEPHAPSPYKSYRPFASNAAAMITKITLPAPRNEDSSSYETNNYSSFMPSSNNQNMSYGNSQLMDTRSYETDAMITKITLPAPRNKDSSSYEMNNYSSFMPSSNNQNMFYGNSQLMDTRSYEIFDTRSYEAIPQCRTVLLATSDRSPSSSTKNGNAGVFLF